MPHDSLEIEREAHIQSGAQLSQKVGALARLFATAVVVAVLVRALLVQPFAIPSNSMAPTLQSGDFVFVNKMAYGWSLASFPISNARSSEHSLDFSTRRAMGRPIEYGDVIVFVSPNGKDYVKRMVARGGDRVAMVDGQLHINGRAIPCKPQDNHMCVETLPNGSSYLINIGATGPFADMPETTVPQGHYFVLGDNRDHSADSRLTRGQGGVGFIPEAHVIGRAAFIFFSLKGAVQWDRIGQKID